MIVLNIGEEVNEQLKINTFGIIFLSLILFLSVCLFLTVFLYEYQRLLVVKLFLVNIIYLQLSLVPKYRMPLETKKSLILHGTISYSHVALYIPCRNGHVYLCLV